MSTHGSPDPLTTPPPNFSDEEAEAVSERMFGVSGAASALDSERDQNFRITGDGASFLLKISNAADDFGAVEMQTLAMLHIGRQDPGLPVMQPLRALNDDLYAELDGASGHRHLTRLFSFLPGQMVESSEMTPGAVGRFGSMVARMGVALRGFFHPAGGYKILWDLKNTPALRELLGDVSDRSQRALSEQVLDRFDALVAPALPGLRSQLIHNDLTLDNVLLDDRHRISGIVDFGDLTHTALICDMAIALVSLMWGRQNPLEVAETAIGGYVSIERIEAGEADLLADLVSARLAALVLIAEWRVRRYPENADYIMANVELAWELLEQLHSIGLADVSERLRAACDLSQKEEWPAADALLDRRRRVLGPALAPLTYERPLYLVAAKGSYMFDDKARRFLDAYNNVPVVGHSHPRVVAAITEQSRNLNTNTRYLHHAVVELAERLASSMPPDLDTVMFVNSGSEANDIAWRLATAYTGGAGAIVTSYAYHGVTTATIALSPEEWAGDRPGHIATVVPPDPYRAAMPIDRCVDQIDEAIAELTHRGVRPAALFVDSLFTSDGIFTPPPTYLQEVLRRLHAAGCLLVADEVQAGFGRIGSHLWSFAASGITPDFVTLGKPMGNGYPVAAVVTRSDIAERFAAKTDLFSTFGGNPVAARAGLAVLDVINDEGLQDNAKRVGSGLRINIEALMERHRAIGDVRGAGLMIGVELVHDRDGRAPAPDLADAVMNDMKERGVLVGTTGPHGNVLKIRPPLVLTVEQADVIATVLDESLGATAPPRGPSAYSADL